ncbi:MAG: glycosyltransferase [Acidimicrobiales bacterium]
MSRLAVLSTDPGIAWGASKGAAVHLAELAAALAQRTDGVDVLVAGIAAPGGPAGVTVEALPGPGKGMTAAARLAGDDERAAWLVERLKPCRPAALYERFALHSQAGRLAAASLGVPHIVELNAPLVEEARRYRTLDEPEAAERLERSVLSQADVVLAVSRPLAAHAERLGARRVVVVPNGVDLRRFPPRPGAGPPVAGFLGTLRPWQGLQVMADAWRILGPEAPHLLVIGDGPGREVLEAVGAEITGSLAHDAVPAQLARAGIGLAPYVPGGPAWFSPLKLFEYLAAGLAVVAADLPGVVDVVGRQGEVAEVVPQGSAPALAAAVAGLVADESRRARLGQAGRRLVAAHHTWDHRATTVLNLVSSCARTR